MYSAPRRMFRSIRLRESAAMVRHAPFVMAKCVESGKGLR